MRSTPAAGLLAVGVLLAACSTTSEPARTTETTTTSVVVPTQPAVFPVEVVTGAGTVTVSSRPERIAALSATHVEMLFAIGAGEQVVAGDLFSNHPPAAAELTQLDSFNLSVEAVVDLDPDLVVLSFDPVDAVSALEAVGIPTLLLGTAVDLEEVYEQIRDLGDATGHRQAADRLAAEMEAEIQGIVSGSGDAGKGLTYYHETDPFGFYTPNSQSFIGRLYALLGMENIADAAPDDLASGFPQLSPEFIISADPDVVFLAGAGETPETLAARDGWGTLSAVETGDVFVLDPDVASRWGPRVVDLLDAIASAAAEVTQ